VTVGFVGERPELLTLQLEMVVPRPVTLHETIGISALILSEFLLQMLNFLLVDKILLH
jgi:hypothetical protein